MATIEIHWWYLAVILGSAAIVPIFRAIAVVVVGRLVPPKLAKIAIPLVLRPVRPSLFAWPSRNSAQKPLKEGGGSEQGPTQGG
jgi:hypothetical protein